MEKKEQKRTKKKEANPKGRTRKSDAERVEETAKRKSVSKRNEPVATKSAAVEPVNISALTYDRLAEARMIILNAMQENADEFRRQANEAAKRNPLGYYLKFILPLMPKTMPDERDGQKMPFSTGPINVHVMVNEPVKTPPNPDVIDV